MTSVTVVIPTRNRRAELLATVESALASTHPDLVVRVFDNHSTDGTREAVIDRFEGQVEYLRAPRPLAMVDSFEAALEGVTTEWVLGLGADDGLHPRAIARLLSLGLETGTRVVTSSRCSYWWPETLGSGAAGELRVPPLLPDEIRDSRRQVRRVLIGKAKFFTLPGTHYNLVRTDVLDELRRRSGRVFVSQTPDVGACFSIAGLLNEFAHCGEPLLIVGLSRTSNGNSQFGVADPSVSQEFWDLNAKSQVKLHARFAAATLPGEAIALPPIMPIIILEAYCQAPSGGLIERMLATAPLQAFRALGPSAGTSESWLRRFVVDASPLPKPVSGTVWWLVRRLQPFRRHVDVCRTSMRAVLRRAREAVPFLRLVSTSPAQQKWEFRRSGPVDLSEAVSLLDDHLRQTLAVNSHDETPPV